MAKRFATLDQLSAGRLRLGIGLGWSRDEYATVGESFTSRGRRCDEAIDAIRTLWRDSPATYHGEFYNFDAVHCVPQPVTGAVPILVGGNSEAAARRAGRTGDGYFPFLKDPEELARLVRIMKRAAEEAERDPASIELTSLGSGHATVVGRLAELGFARMLMFLPEPTPGGIEKLWDKVQRVKRQAGV
jgi:probable F420-dependent oxidoreductase